MILYYSGCGHRPEEAFKETNLMISFFRSLKKPEKRFKRIVKYRRKKMDK